MGFYSRTDFNRKVISLIGAFLIHFVIGTTYTTSNLSIYIASYLREKGSSVTLQELNILFPLQIAIATSSTLIGTMLTTKYSQYLTVCIGNGLVILSVLITSFLTEPIIVILVFGVMYGIGCGLSYTTPLMISWSHFPNHKGRISGIIISGFGFGTTAFNLISTHIINPDNQKPSHKHDGTKYFSDNVSSRLPNTLRILALCYFVISLIGILLLGKMIKPKGQNDLQGSPLDECPSLKSGLKTKAFSTLFLLGFISNMPGLYVASAYKSYGSSEINDDDFLALTGALGSVFNGSFRYVWAQLMDKSSFKIIISILLMFQLCFMGSLYFISQFKVIFLIWICGIYACEGGLATLFPSVIVKCFGKVTGTKIFGVYYYSVALSAISGFVIQLFIVEYFGYLTMFLVMAGLSLMSIFVVYFVFVEENPWKIENRYVLDDIN
ncbi:hypothetical protein SteCoe_21124 [Stentor coeruleus]|uniref:Major facilitator superfamily (MFS) profile domain-containing protein n=1 Tax=Stentor coeruleus TaxID=5963 RepID=A0A1R2BQ78_9CILI|nr:hypothetical protein SteCoe_21124 [Stentor coeruleus]